MIGLDPRTKTYVLLLSNFLLLFHLSEIVVSAFILFLCGLFLLSHKYKMGLKLLVFYIVTFILSKLTFDNIIIYYISYLALTINMMLPCIYSGILLCTTTKPSQMISALRKCKISEKIIIPICVVIRFFPTLRQEVKAISNGMIMRGVGGFVNKIKHPSMTFEYYVIPLLMSATLTIQDLTISAVCKGIENTEPHTSLVVIKLRVVDYIVLGFATLIIFVPIVF